MAPRIWALAACLVACGEGASKVVVDAGPGIPDARPPDAGSEPPTGRLFHVDPEAPREGADGSRAAPYSNITDAYAAARPGDVVLLLAGTYAPPAPPPEGVELLGAGPGLVRVEGEVRVEREGLSLGGFSVHGAGVVVTAEASLRDILVVDAPGDGFVVEAPTELVRCEVQGAAGAGIRASADLAGVDLAIRDTGGIGVLANGGAHTLERVDVRQARGAGLRFVDAEVTLAEVWVAGTVYDETEATGSGIGFVGTHGALRGGVVDGGDRGLRVSMGADVVVEDVVVRRAHTGINVSNGSRITLREVRVTTAPGGGVTVVDGDATLVGVHVADVGRVGLLVSRGTLDGEEVTVDGATERGISLLAAHGSLRNFLVRRAGNVGVQVTDPDGDIHLERGLVEDCATTGVSLLGQPDGGTVELRDLEVRQTRPGEQNYAFGVHLFDTSATLERVHAHENAGAGVLAERSALSLKAPLLNNNGGPGVVAVEPTLTTVVTDAVAVGNAGSGMLFIGGSADVAGADVSGSTPALGEGEGDGITGGFRARLSVRDSHLHENEGSGLVLSGFSDGRLSATRLVANGRFGVFVSCDSSALEEPTANTYADNHEGPRNDCP